MLVNKEMFSKATDVYVHTKYATDSYFYLQDFLKFDTGKKGLVEVPLAIVKKISWVFCIKESGRDECEIFGLSMFDCPFCQANLDLPVCPIFDKE